MRPAACLPAPGIIRSDAFNIQMRPVAGPAAHFSFGRRLYRTSRNASSNDRSPGPIAVCTPGQPLPVRLCLFKYNSRPASQKRPFQETGGRRKRKKAATLHCRWLRN